MFKVDGKKPTEKEGMKTEKIVAKLMFLKMLGLWGSGRGHRGIQSTSGRTGEGSKNHLRKKKRIRSLILTSL